jgi:uncharacterized damage-inducible protein DinB
MADPQRAASGPREPGPEGPAGPERWAGYLDWLREDVVAQVLALDPGEQRTTRLASGWTPLEMLSHLLHMEQRWFVWGFLGEAVARPWGDWNTPEPWLSDDADRTRPEARWVVADEISAVDLVTRLREVGDRTRAVLRDHPMDARGATGGRFGDDPPTLGWICLHVLVEYARHAGHVDVAAELSRG